MRFLTCQGLAPGDLADKVEKVRAAIERDDFRSADVKKLAVRGFYLDLAQWHRPLAVWQCYQHVSGNGLRVGAQVARIADRDRVAFASFDGGCDILAAHA